AMYCTTRRGMPEKSGIQVFLVKRETLDRYPDAVNAGDRERRVGVLRRKVCGGPHATHTGELGHYTIVKQ
ncbi:MAG TPA: hypothetical protein VGK87_09230, partial [Anaerolineae bacterium]